MKLMDKAKQAAIVAAVKTGLGYHGRIPEKPETHRAD